MCEEDVVVGKYRFGMLYKNNTVKCIICNWYTLNSVFMAPECAVSTPWRNVFMNQDFNKRLSVIAVDEAHCIFEWFASIKACATFMCTCTSVCTYSYLGDHISGLAFNRLEDYEH